ncbi:hypothetical protein [uncultured Bradyrhizobium sp.]|uniref:hypothetical protein n=1 Tax=uncultured Bradyrhizobium sp. TaxID=199684 RepID=UPI0034322294
MTRVGEGKLEGRYGRLRGAAFLVLAVFLAICSSGRAQADDDRDRGGESRAYAIGLWGDLPYSDLQAQVGVPNLIADMNGQKLAFTVHDGDLKAGSGTPGSVTPTTCSEGARIFQRAEFGRDVHHRRQRLDRLRSRSERLLLLARTA